MAGWLLVLAGIYAGADTVTIDVSAALERGLEVAPAAEAARHRSDAASSRVRQATRWPNPHAAVAVENLGQSEAFTGTPGVEGLEGQAVLTLPLPIGKERSGTVRTARADERAVRAQSELTALQVRTALLDAMGVTLRDQVLVDNARAEAATLAEISEALALQTTSGRASQGDAARARLAWGMAETRLARREAVLAVSAAELARRLGYGAETVVRLTPSVCSVEATASFAGSEAVSPPAEVRVAEARVDAARGQIDLARGLRTPDFEPQVGVRRTNGRTGLYVGLATSLPLFSLGGGRIDAALAEERAALAERRDAEERWAAARAGAYGVLAALDRAGRQFDAGWFASLEQAVDAAEARFRLGEGTLFELLDSRRARLQALDDYHEWQSEWWRARLELDRIEGRAAPASTICTDPYQEVR